LFLLTLMLTLHLAPASYGQTTPNLSSFSINPGGVVSGSSSTGTVTLSGPAPTSGARVTLTGSNASVTFPTSVYIAPGGVSATFPITTPVAVFYADLNCQLNAAYNGTLLDAILTIASTTRPYNNGSPVAVSASTPARIEAENYDKGGEGIAYHDIANGGDTAYRSDNIGVEAGNVSNGYYVTWTAAGEWDSYTLNVASAGTYTLSAAISSPTAGGTFHLEFGPLRQVGGAGVTKTAEFTVPNTGSYSTFQTVSLPGVALPAGLVWMRLVIDSQYPCMFDDFTLASTAAATPKPTPYSGTPVSVAATGTTKLEAENYDLGGEGIAYHDIDNGSQTAYRTDNVGVYAVAGASNGYLLSYTALGEWDGYTLNVATAGVYVPTAFVGSPSAGGTFHLEFGPVGQIGGTGVVTSAEFTVPNTGNYNTFQSVPAGSVSLPAGPVWMRLVIDSAYPCTFDYFTLTPAPVLTSIVVSPNPVTLNTSGSQQFTAVANDQNGKPLSPQPAIAWTSTGVGTITSAGLYSAGTTAGTATVTAASGSVSGMATVTVNPSSSPAALSLTAAATGANKITLYWNGISGASGYDIYRSTVSGGPYTQIASNVATPDSSPGLTNTFMYSDTAGLTTGTEYFYVVRAVQSGNETVQSNEDSAIPAVISVPWDTGNPTQIINAVSATAALDLEPDIDDSGNSTPARVGVLEVAGPDGAIYMGNFPDGSPAQAFTSHAYSDGNSVTYDDGRVVAEPDYDDPSNSATSSATATGVTGLSPLLAPVPDKSIFPATSPPSGIYREVNSVPGYTGFSAAVGIPNATDRQTINLVDHVSTSAVGAKDFGKHYADAIDIYTGGYVYLGPGTGVNTFPLDAGLQLTLSPTSFGTYAVGYWEPILNGEREPPINPKTGNPDPNASLPRVKLDGSPRALPTGTVEYQEHLSGEVRMQFLTPASPHVADKSVELHFSLPVLGAGTGLIVLAQINPVTKQVTLNNDINEITLVYYYVPHWRSNSSYVIKRINSVAQTLRSPMPNQSEMLYFDPKHLGAPVANYPATSSIFVKGYLNDGCYAVAPIGSGSLAGAYWGNADARGVELQTPGGGWVSWTDDPSITNLAGGYPIPSEFSNVDNWLVQNPYFWEVNVNLIAR